MGQDLTSDPLRFVIYGVGGVGGLFGALLARNGLDTAFIARGAHLDVIRRQGLTVSSPKGEMLVRPRAATADPAELGQADVILLCVKAEQVNGAAEHIAPMMHPESVVIPLQNGVEAADQARRVLGDKAVLTALCGMMSWVSAPGHIRTLGNACFIKFGELDNRRSERAIRLQDIFKDAGIEAEVPADIDVALWEKFLFIASLGGVGAVCGEPFGLLRENSESRRMLELAMTEIFELGRARGVRLNPDVVERTLSYVDELPSAGTASMQRDIAAGRPSELDAWSGAVVRLGRASGVATPVHEHIYEALLPAEEKARKAAKRRR